MNSTLGGTNNMLFFGIIVLLFYYNSFGSLIYF